MKSFRDIRVIPVVLVAIFGLAVLKIAGLVIDGGYVFDYQVSQPAKKFVGAGQAQLIRAAPRPIPPTSPVRSRQAKKEEPPKPAAPAAEAPKPDGVVVFPDQNRAIGVGVRARHPRTAAGAAAGTGAARARNRNSRKPAEVRREAHRRPGRGDEGHRSQDLDRDRAKERSRMPRASRASSRCMRA